MELKQAHGLASGLAHAMKPFIVPGKGVIAGSIRRRKPDVKDIELVIMPRWEMRSSAVGDLFGEREEHVNLLHQWAVSDRPLSGVDGCPRLQWIKPSVPGIEPWGVDANGRYWRGYLPDHDMKVDVFIPRPENWGGILMIRTGSAAFSEAMLTHAKRVGYKFEGGVLHVWRHERVGAVVPTPTEEDVFKVLGLEYVKPPERTGPEALRRFR